VREPRLVDDPDGLAVGFGPEGAPVLAVDVHGGIGSISCAAPRGCKEFR
jgi:dihydrodipicolinate synthase/N-acetylneuraminate lyase